MLTLSNDKNINKLCHKILSTELWIIVRKGKHFILEHIAPGGFKILSIPSTPSDPRAFANFRREYFRYLREYFLKIGWIFSQKTSK